MVFKSTMLFDVLGNILNGKSLELYNKHVESEYFKDAAKFMILKYLTMSNCGAVRDIVLDNYVTLQRMPEKALYKWLLMYVPKQNSSFIRYIK